MSDIAFPISEMTECVVGDAEGLHARPCTRIARAVGRFRCQIRVEWNGRTADAKSVLELMRLTAPRGARLLFVAGGADARRCIVAAETAMAAALV